MPNILKILIGLILLSACSSGPRTVAISGEAFGTTYNVSIVATPDAPVDEAALREIIDATLADVNAEFSNWDASSSVSRFNAKRSDEPHPISADFLKLMNMSNKIHLATAGYFDMTAAPLIELWGFFKPELTRAEPTPLQIDEALSHVGQWDLLAIDQSEMTIRKRDPAVQLNVSAIAKGYGIDWLSGEIAAAGHENFMTEIGGDLYASGLNAQGQAWSLGIEKPVPGQRSIQQIVTVSNQGMATSGDYRNFYEKDGVRYSHIIDPLTGRPVTHRTASVTVLAENATLADGWATALLAMGTEKGLPLADHMGLQVIFIDHADGGTDKDFEVTESAAYIADQAN